MQHELADVGDALVIAFTGDIDLQTSPDARKALLALVGKGKSILVDLSGVGYIDSSGVASLVECLQSQEVWTEAGPCFSERWCIARSATGAAGPGLCNLCDD